MKVGLENHITMAGMKSFELIWQTSTKLEKRGSSTNKHEVLDLYHTNIANAAGEEFDNSNNTLSQTKKKPP